MPAFETKDNSGVLFRNQYKEHDNQPDYRGKSTVDGAAYKIAAWVKTPKKGGDAFLSLAFTPDENETPESRKEKRMMDAPATVVLPTSPYPRNVGVGAVEELPF